MKNVIGEVLACALLLTGGAIGNAQAAPASSASATPLEQRVEALSAALTATQQQLEQSQQKMLELQKQLADLRLQIAAEGKGSSAAPASGGSVNMGEVAVTPETASPGATSASMEERQQTVEAAVKLYDQTKVESSSKYPLRVNGLILMNAYAIEGVPDNTDLPAIAARQTLTSGNGSIGASFRQTILGLEGNGPRIWGARTSANVNFDFFSGLTYTNYGTSAGVVRMRTASINLDWAHDSLEVGMVAPLISPLSPTSYATVGEPSMASAGNLWTWAPQLRFAHQQELRDGKHLQYEFGLWDPASAGYNPNQLFRNATPGELAKQPAYEARISMGGTDDRSLQIGLGGYYSRQAYPGYEGYPETDNLDAWASTADWRLPFGRRFELSGEAYRGRSIGGLGGGVYKDVVTGTDPITGATALRALNAAGGWAQFKSRFAQSFEANISMGQDNGFASDFHAVVLSPTATQSQLRARNRMAIGNFIYRPKTYIIFSPEYRRIWTWPISGPANTLDVFTLSVGYQF